MSTQNEPASQAVVSGPVQHSADPELARPPGQRTDGAQIAPHGLRVAAFGLDVLILLFVFGVLALLGRLTLGPGLFSALTAAVAFGASMACVLGLSVWLTAGQTPGKALCGLVERRIDGAPLDPTLRGLWWALGRHSWGYLVVDVLGIGVLAALVSPRRRCLHDLAFASEVVYIPTADGKPAKLEARAHAFSDRLQTGLDRSHERYGWLFLLWAWLTKVILVVAGALFALTKWAKPAAALAEAPSTPAAAAVKAPVALSTKVTAGLLTSTAIATAGLAVWAMPPSDSAYDYADINVVFSFGDAGLPETSEIYIMRADGGAERQLTSNTSFDVDPVLLDDRLIAFTSDRDGNNEIYLMNVDGSDQRRLTNDAGSDIQPNWSPDGRTVVYSSDRDGNHEIYLMNADGSGQRRLTDDPGSDSQPDWSPDGRTVVFTSDRDGNHEIYLMNADGSDLRRLTDSPGSDTQPDWSPDGRTVVFTSDRDGNREIYLMNADGSDQTRLTSEPASDWNPFWAPGGEKILFSSSRGLSESAGEIWAMDPDGTEAIQLTTRNVE